MACGYDVMLEAATAAAITGSVAEVILYRVLRRCITIKPKFRSRETLLRNRRSGGCVYLLQMFFVFVFAFFVFFPFATKIPDNRSRERLNGFS